MKSHLFGIGRCELHEAALARSPWVFGVMKSESLKSDNDNTDGQPKERQPLFSALVTAVFHDGQGCLFRFLAVINENSKSCGSFKEKLRTTSRSRHSTRSPNKDNT